MTRAQKEILRAETAARLNKPCSDALHMLRKCREAMHVTAIRRNDYDRIWLHLYWSAKSWIKELRAATFALEAASPDRTNARRVA